jgi:phospholipid/cholesterol/gamma-HCH transport system substrate-binding protein
METRANYALIGLFTLAVVAAGFFFVLWFSGSQKQGHREVYKIVFDGSIAGLGLGGNVLFNGVKVGEVKTIDLEPEDPSHVYALVEIDGRVPVRSDTRARLEYTGFTGVASVALTGGSPDAAALKSGPNGGPAVIYAVRSDFQDLVETARRVAGQASDFLNKTNHLLDANSASLTASVKNVEKFSDALAANSDGLKDFMGSMADIGKSIKPLTVKLEVLAGDADNVVKAVDPEKVKSIVSDFSAISSKLNAAAGKVDGVLTNLNGFLATSDSKGVFDQVSAAAKSIKKLADNLDLRSKDLLNNLNHFSGSGLRQYEALAADGRKTLDQIKETVRSIENNPQQFLFGKKSSIPEYSGSR